MIFYKSPLNTDIDSILGDFLMADRKKNFDDEMLRQHLEEQRANNRTNENSPSLVSLVEGDNNAIFKPITFISIIGTVIFAIVTSVTQIINFNNTFGEMEKTINTNAAQVVEMRSEIDELRNDLRQQLSSNTTASSENIERIVNRLVNLERKVDSEMRVSINTIDQNTNTISSEVIDIKEELRSMRQRLRDNDSTIGGLETQLRVLEIRYERIVGNS